MSPQRAQLPQHVLILSTADWVGNLRTNKQHLAAGLARAGLQVTFCESLGLRSPHFTTTDISRIIRRLRAAFKGNSSPDSTRLEVASPIALPAAYGHISQMANPLLLEHQLRSWTADDKHCRVLWTFSPVTFGLERFADLVIYHSVDFLGAFPGVPRSLVDEAEKRVLENASAVIASSKPIASWVAGLGRGDVLLWENVADVEVFRASWSDPREPGSALFAGNLTPAKVDYALLGEVAENVTRLHLAGPIDEGGKGGIDFHLRAILSRSNVTYHGVLEPQALAQLAGSCRIGLIPYTMNAYTRGVFPLKVFEYLAAGCAVLSTPLPALENIEISSGDYVAVEAESWPECLDVLMSAPKSEVLARRLRTAEAHSWTRRIIDAQRLLSTLQRNQGF